MLSIFIFGISAQTYVLKLMNVVPYELARRGEHVLPTKVTISLYCILIQAKEI